MIGNAGGEAETVQACSKEIRVQVIHLDGANGEVRSEVITDTASAAESIIGIGFAAYHACGQRDSRFGPAEEALSEEGNVASPVGIAASAHAVIKLEWRCPVTADLGNRRETRGEVVAHAKIAAIHAGVVLKARRKGVTTQGWIISGELHPASARRLRAGARQSCPSKKRRYCPPRRPRWLTH